MVLDNEDQKQKLIELINVVPITGNIQQTAQILNELTRLLQAVKEAKISAPEICIDHE